MRTHSSSRSSVRLAGLVLLLLEPESLLLLLEPARVVPLEGHTPTVVELEDPLGDVVEEVAVVGDGDDGAGVVLEEPLEPGDRLGVEVVRRLVEQQQVGVDSSRRHSATRRRSPPESTLDVGVAGGRRSASIAISIVRWRSQASAASIFASSSACSPRASRSRRRDRPAGQDLVVSVEQVRHLADAVHHVAQDVLGRVELRLLLEHSRR
jgi:hypothetical protein